MLPLDGLVESRQVTLDFVSAAVLFVDERVRAVREASKRDVARGGRRVSLVVC